MPTYPIGGSNHPALKPENIKAVIKEKYKFQPIARSLFRDEEEPVDEFIQILQKDFVGSVGDISGRAGFKFVESQFESTKGKITPYGGAFEVWDDEIRWSKTSLVSKKMKDLVFSMRKYYEQKVLSAIINAVGISSLDGTNWNDLVNGDPFIDFEGMIKKVEGACGVIPDVAIMNTTMYLKLMKFKEYREYQFLGQSNIMQSGIVNKVTPNGLKLIVFPDTYNTVIANDVVWVCKTKDMGANHIAVPVDTLDREVPGQPLGKRYYTYEYAKPFSDKVDATFIGKLYGLGA